MLNEHAVQLPPLQGCLYCHSEGTTELTESRKVLGFGSPYPTLTCHQCGALALLDVDPENPEVWRVRYRRVDRSDRYYYVSVHLGRAGWLSSQEALTASTDGYVQRQRVQQARVGDLSWLQPAPLRPPLPLMSPDEKVYLSLKAVTFQRVPPRGFWVRVDQGAVVDSGKFFLTERKMHLLGQRRDWSHPVKDIVKVTYDEISWTIVLNALGQPQQFRGMHIPGQMDPQLVAEVAGALWHSAERVS